MIAGGGAAGSFVSQVLARELGLGLTRHEVTPFGFVDCHVNGNLGASAFVVGSQQLKWGGQRDSNRLLPNNRKASLSVL